MSGHQVSDVEMPKMKCGLGMSSTIETPTAFRGHSFRVESLPLPYTMYPRAGGAPYSAQDVVVLTGTFTSSTTAEGTVVTKVYRNRTVMETCGTDWEATKF